VTTDPLLHAVLVRQVDNLRQSVADAKALLAERERLLDDAIGRHDREAAHAARAARAAFDDVEVTYSTDAWGLTVASCSACPWRSEARADRELVRLAADLHERAHQFGWRVEVTRDVGLVFREGQAGTVVGYGSGIRNPPYNGDELEVLFDGVHHATTIATRHTKEIDR
jgi:hypothetical protein